jgi:hypothetical protein
MYTLSDLTKKQAVEVEINKKWVPARPLPEPFIYRLKDAWAVLIGRADAFLWPEGQ